MQSGGVTIGGAGGVSPPKIYLTGKFAIHIQLVGMFAAHQKC